MNPKDIIAAIVAGLDLLTGLKKKPHKLLVWNVLLKRWERTHDGGMSARNCRKLLKTVLGAGGALAWLYIIVRENVHEADIPSPMEPGK